MGHQTLSGPAKRKLGSLRRWKLVTVKKGRVEFADLGKRLALPTTADGSARIEDVREAFRSFEPFSQLYESYAKNEELEIARIANQSVHDGYSATGKDSFASSFVDSAEAAGLAKKVGDGSKVRLLPEDAGSSATGEREDESDDEDGRQEPPVPERAAPVASPSTNFHQRQRWQLPEGEIVLEVRLNSPLPMGAYAKVGAAVAAIEKIAGGLKSTGRKAGSEDSE